MVEKKGKIIDFDEKYYFIEKCGVENEYKNENENFNVVQTWAYCGNVWLKMSV